MFYTSHVELDMLFSDINSKLNQTNSIIIITLTSHAYLEQNLSYHQQEQVLEAYSYPAEVLEGISNFQALEVAYQSIHWTASFYKNANKIK